MNHSNRKNLKLLCLLRCIAIGGQSIAILVVTYALQIPLQTRFLWVIIALLAIVNAVTWLCIASGRDISDREFFAQLLIDMSALFGLLYFTGGATNPFASLFILQVIIAAVVLPPPYTWTLTALSIGFYTALMFWSVEVPYFMHHHIGDFFNLHVQGMWISFILLALVIAGFVVRMNSTIRRQNALLGEAEKIAALGTLAASAAHELGTPLATLTMLSENAGELSPIFKEQLQRCKQILARITAAGGAARGEGGAPVALAVFLGNIIKHWQAERADVALSVDIQPGESPRILGDYALEQVIRTMLDNAADASAHFVRLQASWTAQQITVRISDKGTGIAPEPQPGTLGVTTKDDGLGLGLFLARSVIARLEGTLSFSPAEGGGTMVEMVLPLRKLAV